MRKPHHRILFYLFTGGIVTVLAVHFINERYLPDKEFEQIDTHITVESAANSKDIRGPQPQPKNPAAPPPTPPAPKTFSLKVPFTPQAPTANWDELHNEACEEASAIMAYFYFKGDTRATLPPSEVEVEIAKLTEWEENHFGYHLDINSQETAQLVKEVYGLNAKIVTDFTEEYVKEQLRQNHLILWPANGKLLGNPNFRSGGPPYHMIVLRGYEGSQFITNDPGTRKGMNYPYSYNTLYKSNGDFDHSTHAVNLNKKMIIVVWK